MIAFVFAVMASSIFSGSILNVSGRISAKIGVAPKRVMQLTEAKNVKLGTITSSPGPMPIAISASSNASLPDAQPTAFSTWLRCRHLVFQLRHIGSEQKATAVNHIGQRLDELFSVGPVFPIDIQ